MKDIVCGPRLVPYVTEQTGIPVTEQATGIFCTKNGAPIAGMVYDLYNGASVGVHIAIERPPLREWFLYIFDYPFNVLKVGKLIGQVREDNTEVRKLGKSFGFVEESVITGFFPGDVSLVVLTMTRSQCRVLGAPSWGELRNRVWDRLGRCSERQLSAA